MLSLFLFNVTATTAIYTLSLHDALPISKASRSAAAKSKVRWSRRWSAASIAVTCCVCSGHWRSRTVPRCSPRRSEEHTSELQSQSNLVCRLLLEKKKRERRGDAPCGGNV